MSETTSPVDFLSFCPSLVDILRYLHCEDVPKCRLVNKRLSDVIQNHYLTLPRRKTEIDIKLIVLEWPIKFASVEFTKHYYQLDRKVVYITEKRTTLMKSRLEVIRNTESEVNKYYKKNGIPSENEPEQEDEQIWDVISGKHTEQELERSLSYQNNGIEDGLRILLSILCPHCNFTSIKLSQEFAKGSSWQQKKQLMIPEEWLNLMEQALLQNRCYCEELDIAQYSPKIEGLVTATDCREISVLSKQTAEDFMRHLLEFISWSRRLRVCISFEQFQSLEEIGQLLEQWETGSLSLNQVELRILYSLTTKWSYAIDHLMSELKEALFEKKTIPNKQIDYVVTRLVDNKTIQLTCEGNFLSIKELL